MSLLFRKKNIQKIAAISLVFLFVLMSIIATNFSPYVFATNNEVPVWAFNGAYATYNFLESNGTLIGKIRFIISNVNATTKTFTSTEILYAPNGSIVSNQTIEGSFSNPLENMAFLAVNNTDLQILKSGQIPADFQSNVPTQVIPNVKMSVPAGTFNTIEIETSEGPAGPILYIDQNTGIIIYMAMPSQSPTGEFTTTVLELTSTNIISSSSLTMNVITSNLIWIIIAVVVIVVVVLLLFLMKRKGKTNSSSSVQQTQSSYPTEHSFSF